MNEEQQPGNLPKRINFEKPTFEANGKTYTVEAALSITRYAELQVFEKELGFGFTFKQMVEKLQTMWNNQNKMKFAENAVILNDLIRGVAKVQERTPTILKVCALFINTPDEDRNTIDQALIDRKIEDWKAEGMDMRDFFSVAFSSINGFLETYKKISRIISETDGEKTGENQ